MNPEKLKKLEAQVRIGGKGTARRKKKITHGSAISSDKKLQLALKKCGLVAIPGADEANMFKDDGTVIHFQFPQTQGSMPTNMLAFNGHAETKNVMNMLPGVLSQLGPASLKYIQSQAKAEKETQEKADDAKGEVPTGANKDNADDDIFNLITDFDAFGYSDV